jgi:hypothetical protein
VNGGVPTRSLRGLLAGMPDRFRIDRLITAMVMVARKEPDLGFSPQAMPVFTEFFEQLSTEHHVSVFASLAPLDVNHHALAVDIAELEVRQLGIPSSGGIKRHQQSAMERSAGRIDELRNFFLAEDGRETVGLFRIRSLGNAPGLLKRLSVKEPQGGQSDRNGARRQLSLLEQLGLVFANVSRA